MVKSLHGCEKKPAVRMFYILILGHLLSDFIRTLCLSIELIEAFVIILFMEIGILCCRVRHLYPMVIVERKCSERSENVETESVLYERGML